MVAIISISHNYACKFHSLYSSNNDIGVIYNPPDLSLMGKTIKMKFATKEGVEKWYKGTITSHDGRTGKYGVYFPCDKQTVFILPNDPDIDCN